ncbi:uncharacterized protein LOC144665107 [Oculina patagonica]
MKAVCKDGYCVCTGKDYDYETCLPDAYGCKIIVNDDEALAIPRYKNQRQMTYSCTPKDGSTEYEVHVLSVYEALEDQRVILGEGLADARVNIVSHGKSDRPIILALGSYQPLHWILNLTTNITISKIIMPKYDIYSTVNVAGHGRVFPRYSIGWGIGRDTQFGDTILLLE